MKRRFAPPGRRPPGESCGFTLLELLIATAVGGIVLLVIQTTFFGALRLHNTTHERTEADRSLQQALNIVRRDLSGLLLPGGVMSGHLQTTTFSSTVGENFGDRVGPDFHTNSGRIDGWNPFSEAQRVTYYLATSSEARAGSGKDLLRVVQRNLLPVQDEAGEPQVILRNVLEATVEFFDGMGWTDTWDSEATSTLPTAVKFRVALAPPENSTNAPAPYELVVPVLVKTSASLQAEAEAAAAL